MRALLALALLLAVSAPAGLGAAEGIMPRRVDIEFAVYLGSMRIGEGAITSSTTARPIASRASRRRWASPPCIA